MKMQKHVCSVPMIGWTHIILLNVSKSKRFCLTLLGETRLWYQSIEPINADWQGLKNLFRQQYSKIGNTRGQLFHAWRFFQI